MNVHLRKRRLHNTAFMESDTVRVAINQIPTIEVIDKKYIIADGSIRYQVWPLNSTKKCTLNPSDVTPIHPDPTDIPTSLSEIDRATFTYPLAKDDLKKLWTSSSNNTIANESWTTLYWHHCIHCVSLCVDKTTILLYIGKDKGSYRA